MSRQQETKIDKSFVSRQWIKGWQRVGMNCQRSELPFIIIIIMFIRIEYKNYVCDRIVVILAGEEVDSIFTNSEKMINIKWLDD